jgi:hypothetical protein
MEIMKLKWTQKITLGLLIGISSPFVFMPIILFVLSQSQYATFSSYWDLAWSDPKYTSKYLSLGLISNLLWFYLFLNREKYEYSRGIILGMLCFIPFMIYVNLFL